MTKEIFDRLLSLFGLVVLSPLFVVVLLLVFLQDGRSPLFVTERAGRQGRPFRMVKIRSMVAGADRLGGTSSPSDDGRITALGAYIRRFKIDEFFQLWNVLQGEMSLVGPRPQTIEEVASYSTVELGLLDAKPGITDFASIVFADEGEILRGAANPGLAYRQLIRPWKSRLGLFYVAHHTVFLDLQLIALTLLRIVAPDRAIERVCQLLTNRGAPEELVRVARRVTALVPHAAPGMDEPFKD